jgi:hypothetical protein
MRLLTAVLCVLVSLGGSGCTFAVPERKLESAVHAQKDVAVTANQLRLRMRSLVGPMSGEIEQAADQIIARTTSDAVKRAALRWKLEGVPALRKALFEPDPFSAVMDTWVLSNQMADYFERGPGREALGESAVIAVAACRRMEEDFTRVVASMTISGDVSKARAFARKWAAEHPIGHAIATRETALSRILERDAASSHSTAEIVAGLTTAVDDLGRRLDLYSDQLFRQARWELESFKSEVLPDFKMDQVLPLTERVVKSAERVVATIDRLVPIGEGALRAMEEAPKFLLGEREAVIKALQDDLTKTIKFAQEQGIAALEHLTRERIAALEHVTNERIVTLEYLTKERIAAFNEVRETLIEERRALAQDVERVSLKVLDHASWRAAQLLTLLLVALIAGFFALRRSGPGRSNG